MHLEVLFSAGIPPIMQVGEPGAHGTVTGMQGIGVSTPKAAAVADFTIKRPADQKLKRKGAITLELEPTSDILAEIGRSKKQDQILAGFAAETENVLENARKKLKEKNCDLIVVNDVSREGIGFDSERNAVTILTADETIEVPETSKWEVAQRVLDCAVRLKKSRGVLAPSR